jgi:hypothetical protein
VVTARVLARSRRAVEGLLTTQEELSQGRLFAFLCINHIVLVEAPTTLWRAFLAASTSLTAAVIAAAEAAKAKSTRSSAARRVIDHCHRNKVSEEV